MRCCIALIIIQDLDFKARSMETKRVDVQSIFQDWVLKSGFISCELHTLNAWKVTQHNLLKCILSLPCMSYLSLSLCNCIADWLDSYRPHLLQPNWEHPLFSSNIEEKDHECFCQRAQGEKRLLSHYPDMCHSVPSNFLPPRKLIWKELTGHSFAPYSSYSDVYLCLLFSCYAPDFKVKGEVCKSYNRWILQIWKHEKCHSKRLMHQLFLAGWVNQRYHNSDLQQWFLCSFNGSFQL